MISHDAPNPLQGQLWRRVPCSQTTVDAGRRRPSTAVFDDWKDELGEPDPISAFRAIRCVDPLVAMDGHAEGYGLISITEDIVRECNLNIVDREVPGPPGHVLLVGTKTKSVRKRLANTAQWVIPCP